MAEPYLDRAKLIQFLERHPPEITGNITALLDSSTNEKMRTDYSIVLKVSTSSGILQIGLEEAVLVYDLFPAEARLFTMFEIADWAEDGSLVEQYVLRVQDQLKWLRWQLTWAPQGASLDIGKVKKEADLAFQRCFVRAQGSIVSQASAAKGAGYSVHPYSSMSDGPIQLGTLLTEATLQEAWQACWERKMFKNWT